MTEITFNDWKQPNKAVVKHFTNAFDINNYKIEEELKYLFSSDNPLTEEVIKSRVTTLNIYYHTRLYSGATDAIIKYLIQHGADIEGKLRDLESYDYSVAGAISSCESHNTFSFATKYCSFVNPIVYPIFDNQVRRVLNYFQKRDRFYADRWLRLDAVRQECDYQKFVDIIDAYCNYYELDDCGYREIDKFLWLVGANIKSFGEIEEERDSS